MIPGYHWVRKPPGFNIANVADLFVAIALFTNRSQNKFPKSDYPVLLMSKVI